MVIPSTIDRKSYIPYIVPFGVFAVFIYLGPLLGLSPALVYPAQTMAVAACLLYFARFYRQDMQVSFSGLAIISGILVFVVWVGLESHYRQMGHTAFNPFEHASGAGACALIGFRLAGAVLVVPIMEELFWRSFALRVLIDTDFIRVPLGRFTWFSFLIVSVAFGLAHHRWLPGIIAGLVYALLLYCRKNLFDCIVAHATTNLLLGIYVLATRQWTYW